MSTQNNFENAFLEPKDLKIRIQLLNKKYFLSFEKFISICTNSNLDTKMNISLLKGDITLLSSSSPRTIIEALLSLQSNTSINQNVFITCKNIMESAGPLYASFCCTPCPMEFEYY